MSRFQEDWQRYFRGELQIKNDVDVSDQDVQQCNLILFGDPSSNRLINKVLPHLPLKWTKDEIEFGGLRVTASAHMPALIYPNPLATQHYIVLNSGHSFGAAELSALNYLLFPRLGDWSIFRTADNDPIRSGFFDERWQTRP